MLHPVGKLRQYLVRNVGGALGNKVYADALGADQLDHLHDLLDQGPGSVGKEQMGLVKAEDHPGLFQIAPGSGAGC